MGILQFLSNFYWPLLGEVAAQSYRDARRHGDSVGESLVGAVTGHNAAALFVPLYGKHDGRSIQKLLKSNGIDMWGWSTYGDEQFFHVHRDDEARAYRILRAAGVELSDPF